MATEWKSQQADGMFYLQFETDNKEKYKLVEKAAQMAIDGKTTADVVEVVRCRECRHCNHLHDEFDNDWYFCTLTINNAEVQGDWYCSRGERRTDNDV